eukprot:12983321-Ditylum_brightwellii.AAC.1
MAAGCLQARSFFGIGCYRERKRATVMLAVFVDAKYGALSALDTTSFDDNSLTTSTEDTEALIAFLIYSSWNRDMMSALGR